MQLAPPSFVPSGVLTRVLGNMSSVWDGIKKEANEAALQIHTIECAPSIGGLFPPLHRSAFGSILTNRSNTSLRKDVDARQDDHFTNGAWSFIRENLPVPVREIFKMGAAVLRSFLLNPMIKARLSELRLSRAWNEYTNFDVDILPTLEDEVGLQPKAKKAVQLLQYHLSKDPQLLRFLGYSSPTLNVFDTLRSLRIRRQVGFAQMAAAFFAVKGAAVYDPVDSSGSGCLAHELLHALHFKAVTSAVDIAAMKRVMDLSEAIKLAVQQTDNKSLQSWVGERLQTIQDFLEMPENHSLNQQIKEKTADLIWFYAHLNFPDRLEAIASRFDIANLGVSVGIARLMDHHIFIPLHETFFGSSREQRAKRGYSNSRIYEQTLRKGLINSLLEE